MKVIHVDMDAFFTSVEQLDHPELRGRPIVVGGSPTGRGVVAAASYEARRFGIHSAMPAARAKRLCAHLVLVRPNFERYKEISRQVFGIFREVTDLVEPLSIDEAYLDVTENHLGEPLAREVAKHIRARVREEVGLTCSAGVGPSKFVAKVASDLRKPDGLMVVPPQRVQAFIDALPVERIWGVGPATAARLHRLGLRTAKDIRLRPTEVLEGELGRMGRFIHALSCGEDARKVVPERQAKSRGAERTFAEDVTDLEALVDLLRDLAERVGGSLERMGRPGRTITLKLRYSDFETITRSRTLPEATFDAAVIAATAEELLTTGTSAGRRPARLIGVSVSSLITDQSPTQLSLPFPAP